jgi:hypothetical protein
MRQSLFEQYAPPQPPPRQRLQPNVFAALAQYSIRNAGLMIVLWFSVAVAVVAIGMLYGPPKTIHNLTFNSASSAKNNMAILDASFPNLNSLIQVTLTNPNATKLKLSRTEFIETLQQQPDIFETVFAPGAGEFYDTNAMLYHDVDDVKARVAYALSLRPLFAAIAEAPNTQSLATLVNEVSASIELGRDPQGLDALFAEAAISIKNLIEGVERPVDWTVVAGLNVDPQAISSLVLALPKKSKNTEALAAIAKLTSAGSQSSGTTSLVQTSPQNPDAQAPVPFFDHAKAAVPIAIIFLMFILFLFLGDFAFSMLIVVPCLVIVAIIYGGCSAFLTYAPSAIWPFILTAALSSITLSMRFVFAAVEALNLARSKQSAAMLAAQKQGSGLLFLGLTMAVPWSAWCASLQKSIVILSLITVLSLLAALLASLTLVPALLRAFPQRPRWQAAQWLEPLFNGVFDTKAWRALRKILAWLFLVLAITGFWQGYLYQAPVEQKPASMATVNILAATAADAETIVKQLNAIPQAQAVRWLGAFLPQQVPEKQVALQELHNQFPNLTPLQSQDPLTLRDQISTLLESLQAIANSPATRAPLAAAAHDLRRSLELLAATSSNAEIIAFENRIFGSFNVLPRRAEALSNIAKPDLSTLDPQLTSLFKSESGIYRLEVTPANGQTAESLARMLNARNFNVAHPALEIAAKNSALSHNSLLITLATALLGVLMIAISVAEVAGAIASLVTGICALAVLAIFAINQNFVPSVEMLAGLTALFTYLLASIAMAFVKVEVTALPLPATGHAVEAWLPNLVLAVLTIPAVFLDTGNFANSLASFNIAMAIATLSIVLLLRPLTLLLRG